MSKNILYSKQIRLKWIRSRIKSFLLLLVKNHPDAICKSHYLHILGCYIVDFLERYDCLIKYSNQGFENSHQLHKLAWKRATNGRGGKINVSPIRKLLLWQFRQVEMTLYLELSWNNTNFKKKFSYRRLYELEDISYDTFDDTTDESDDYTSDEDR
jgi:hypothetical protein